MKIAILLCSIVLVIGVFVARRDAHQPSGRRSIGHSSRG
jgi:hypothetical protein